MEKHSKEIMQWVCEIALSDSQTAFKSLYLAYFQRLMRFTSLYVPSSVEAEEIVSDTFLSLWNNRKSLPEISNFDSYIYGMLQAVTKKLDAQLAPEWLNLSPKIKEACTEYNKCDN